MAIPCDRVAAAAAAARELGVSAGAAVLLEFQSEDDRWMALRILTYSGLLVPGVGAQSGAGGGIGAAAGAAADRALQRYAAVDARKWPHYLTLNRSLRGRPSPCRGQTPATTPNLNRTLHIYPLGVYPSWPREQRTLAVTGVAGARSDRVD